MRIDKFLAEKYGSRTKAARAVEKGEVLVDGKTVAPSYEVSGGENITFLTADLFFVSVGGFKLEKALRDFDIDVSGKVFADIGASTGGFTDCLLQRGAAKVYCVDVGESLLDSSLLDKNVVVIDNFNARNLAEDTFAERLDGIVADVSFISLTYILEGVARCLPNGGIAVVLVKPQFELDRSGVGKNGIVRENAKRAEAISRVYNFAVTCDLAPVKITTAPINKNKNVEYPLLLVKGGRKTDLKNLLKCVSL